MTNSLLCRVSQQRAGAGGAFTRRYKVERLVWFEEHALIDEAIQREKNIKRYLRDWTINLIEAASPHWVDLYVELPRRHGIGNAGTR